MRSSSRRKRVHSRKSTPSINSSVKIVLGLLVVLMGFASVLTYGPSFTGLFGADSVSGTLTLDKTFTETSVLPLHFVDVPQSVLLTGSAQGQGRLTVRLLSGTQSHTIVDVVVDGQQALNSVCEETCALSLETSDPLLDVQVTGNMIFDLKSLAYDYVSTNSAPMWTGRGTSFVVRRNEPLVLDLSNYFYDADKDTLTYVVTADEAFSVDLSLSNLIVTPAQDYVGQGEIVIFVSDLQDTIRVPVTLSVEVVSSFALESMNAPADVSADLLSELSLVDELDVIVVMKKDSAMNPPITAISSNVEKEQYINQRKKVINAQTKSVLSTLNLAEFKGRGITALLTASTAAINQEPVDFRLKGAYSLEPAFAGRITSAGYQKLINDPRVERIVKDLPAKLNTNESIPHARAAMLKNMTLAGMNLNGTGFSACVIDSGIERNDTAFGGFGASRILNETCFCSISDYGNGGCCVSTNSSSDGENATDDYGHGNLVSSVIASSNFTFPGAAPGAGIVAVRTFNGSGDALFSDIGLAIDKCISNATTYNISVISMSFGTNRIGTIGTTFDALATGFSNADVCDNLTSDLGTMTGLLNTAAGLGIIPVAAAGNDGFITGISYPACLSNVTSVSSVDNRDDSIPDFSNSIELNDAWADGVDVCGARGNDSNNLQGGAGLGCDDQDNFIMANGTSFSAPILSGIILVLQQVVAQEGLPNLTVERVRQLLNSSDLFILDTFNGVVRPKVEGFNMVVKLARNFTMNLSAGTILKEGIGQLDYVDVPDMTQILSCVNISSNNIFINNSANCGNFQSSNDMTFFNVAGIQTARAEINGTPCPASICVNISQIGDNFTFNTASAGTFGVGDSIQFIDTCRVLNTPSTVYKLNASVAANETCFTINKSSITIDCEGKVIEFGKNGSDSVQGVIATGQTDITVQNCVINDVNSSGFEGIGIFYTELNDSFVLNNTIQTNGSDSNYGIFAEQVTTNLLVANNTVRTLGISSDNYGVYLFTNVSNSRVVYNTIFTNGTDGNYGLLVEDLSLLNTLGMNTITTVGFGTDNYGIYLLTNANNNTIISNNIQTNGTAGDYGIVLESSVNDTVQMNNVSTSGSTTDNYGIYLFENSLGHLVDRNNITTSGTDFNHGIFLERTSGSNTITDNTISAVGSGFDNYGIYAFTSSGSNQIVHNTISTSGVDGNYGFVAENLSTTNNFSYNTISTVGTGTDNYGIFLLDNGVSMDNVFGNVIRTAGTSSNFGIVFDGTSNGDVMDNRVTTAGSASLNFGVYLFNGSSNVVVHNNTITANGSASNDGVEIEDRSNNNNITNNTIIAGFLSVDNYGVRVYVNSTNNIVSANSINTFGLATDRGLNIGSRDNTFVDNRISASGTSGSNVGMYCSAINNTFMNNTVFSTGTISNHGVWLTNGCNSTILRDNVIVATGTITYGVLLLSASDNLLNANSLTTMGGGAGVLLTFGANNNTFENTTIYSTDKGIWFANANSSMWTSTVLNNTPVWISSIGNSLRNNFTLTLFNTTDGHINNTGGFRINSSMSVNKSNLDVTLNSAFQDSDVNPEMNTSATVLLRGVTFAGLSIPVVQIDDDDDGTFSFCNATVCTAVTLDIGLGTALFDTLRFTTYKVGDNFTGTGHTPVASNGGNGQAARIYYGSISRQPYASPVISPPIRPPVEVEVVDMDTESPSIEEPVIQLPPIPEPYCGDGLCERGEDSFGCPSDCGVPPPQPSEPEPTKFPWKQVSALLFAVSALIALTLGVIKVAHRRPPSIKGPRPGTPAYNTQVDSILAGLKPPKKKK